LKNMLESGELKKIANSGTNPTFSRLDDLRKEIGSRLKHGDFANSTEHNLNKIYDLLRNTLDTHIADKYGKESLDKVLKAKGFVRDIQKPYQKAVSEVFGKNIDKSDKYGIISGAVDSLKNGNSTRFERTIKALPSNARKDAVITGLKKVFLDHNDDLRIGEFNKWAAGLLKNSKSLESFEKHAGEEATEYIKNLHKITESFAKRSKKFITTGKANSIKDLFDEAKPKFKDIAKESAIGLGTVATAEILGSGGLGLVLAGSRIGSKFFKNKGRSVINDADDFLANPHLIDAVLYNAQGNTKKASESVAAMNKTSNFKKWLSNLKPTTKAKIANMGFLNWLNSDKKNDEGKQ
jgi:hypothetical protein